ncbi:MAG: acyl-ACP thioesterase [Alistipes sp.]|nr:acyl-ACP thioesterase [Alistipes sp.]
MAEKAYFKQHVEPQDLDFTSRLKAPNLIMAALNAAGRDAHNKGFDYVDMEADNHTWVLGRMAIEVKDRPKQYSDYQIETWISGYNRILSTRNFRMYDEQGQEFAVMTSQWAMLDMTTRSSVDLTQTTGKVHDIYIVPDPEPCAPACRLRPLSDGERHNHRVRYSDIDFNRHMNTIRYIEMIFDRLPIEAISENRPFRLDLHFLNEAVLGEMLTITTAEQEGTLLFEIASEEKTCVRASVRFLE